jgi:hypothetical protein
MNCRLLVTLFALTGGLANAAESPADFAFALAIENASEDALYRLGIPQTVYESAAFADLRDVRVFNAAGEVVPHAFAPQVPVARRSAPVALPFFPLRGPRGASADDLDLALEAKGTKMRLRVRLREADSRPAVLLGYLIDASTRKEMFSSLRLEWREPPAGYVGALRLDASSDLRQWTTVAANAPVVSLEHGSYRLERKDIDFGPQSAKYLRLTWPDQTAALTLSGVMAVPVEQSEPPVRAWKEAAAAPDARRPGDYVADLGGVFPVDRLAIRLPQDNAVAPLQIFSRNAPADEWRPVARTVAYRLRQDSVEIANPELAVTPAARRHWLLRVDQKGGGVGEGAIQVRAGWIGRELVFAARGPGPFQIAYGNGRAQPNALAIQTLVPGWGTDSAPRIGRATVGSVRTLAGEAAARQRIDLRKWGLWGALLAGVALLGWMAWRLSSRLRSEERP